MDKLLKLLSVIGLILSVLPAFLSFGGVISFEQYKVLLMMGAVVWFTTAPAWINKRKAV